MTTCMTIKYIERNVGINTKTKINIKTKMRNDFCTTIL